jgi:hypothetical protein
MVSKGMLVFIAIFRIKKFQNTVTQNSVGGGGGVLQQCQETKVPERHSGLHSSEKELPESIQARSITEISLLVFLLFSVFVYNVYVFVCTLQTFKTARSSEW